jgi:hypothetical protein
MRLRERTEDRTLVTPPSADTVTTYRSSAARADRDEPTLVDARTRTDADRNDTDPTRADRANSADRTRADRATDRERAAAEPVRRDADRAPAPTPRARGSVTATLALVVGVTGALLVLSGILAGYGTAVGGLAVLLGIAGFSATGRRHVAGKTDAVLGLLFGLGAVVVGVLALTHSLHWLTVDTQPLTHLRQWLDAQFVRRF